MKEYLISEIFTSFQGEGCMMGRTANFIRLAECNLSCSFCDTNYLPSRGKMSAQDIVKELEEVDITVITGGEPTLQNLTELIAEIRRVLPSTIVALETNGTLPTTCYDLDWIACSPKPQNGFQIHPECIPHELKYVVNENFNEEFITYERVLKSHIWLQPDATELATSIKKACEIAKKLNLRVGMQMHKYYEFL